MKLHYTNVIIINLLSLACCVMAMICNDSDCGDKTDRSDMYNASGAMIGFVLLFTIITGLFLYGKFEKFFGLWYFLTLCVAIISASFALQCSETCDQLAEGTKTATRGVAGFLIPWTVLAGGYGFYKYITSREAEGGAFKKIGAGLGEFKRFFISDKETQNIAKEVANNYK